MEGMVGLKGKTALVTGGAGFIGSHLSSALANLGVKIIALDICIDPRSFYVRNKVYSETIFELADIRDKNQVSEVFNKYSPDYVFHLAAEPIVEHAYDNPPAAFETNIMGTVNVLEASRNLKNLKGVVVASSDKAYGKTKKAYTEESPLKGDHPYDVSKSSADLIAQTYYKTYGLPVVITRFGNVYGEGDIHFDRIIPGICEALIRNRTLDIRSNGRYIRDYLYVKDVVEGYLFLAENVNRVLGEAFNFSSNENLSVVEVIRHAEQALGKKIPYKILNIARNEIPYQHLNDLKVKKFGWKNKYGLDTTLENILRWYKANI